MLFFLIVLSFLAGAIPFAVVVGKVFYKTDIRTQGSGNPGASNTLRVLGVKAGLLVLLLDMLKGALPVLMAKGIAGGDPWLAPAAGAAAVLGHVFSPFLKFKGGKGVATAVGAMIALEPLFGLFVVTSFLIVVFASRYASLSSMTAAIVFTLLVLVYRNDSLPETLFAIGVTLLIILKHQSNIMRLLKGEENKLKFGKKEN